MHNNYFFLKKLSGSLKQKIPGWKIGTCFSQEKNELIIGLYAGKNELYIRVDQNPQFSCLSFPESFSRAKKNSIDLFPRMIDCRILDVYQYSYERAFSFMLENDLLLVFKLFGNFSNIMLFENGECIDVFKHNLNDEEKISPETLDRKIVIDEAGFYASGCDPKKYIPAFDDHMMQHLVNRGFFSLKKREKWKLFEKVLVELEHPSFYVVTLGDKIKFRLYPEGKVLQQFSDPLQAVTDFYYTHQKQYWLQMEKSSLLKILKGQLKKHEQYILKAGKKQDEWLNHLDYRQKADIIMANLHALNPGLAEAELFDFYHDEMVKIRLNPKLSPQKNAEQFYRKSKNQKKEVEILRSTLDQKKNAAARLQQLIREIEEAENLKILRALNEKYKIERVPGKDREPGRFKSYEHMGFKILVGRNSRNNEELTFEYGYKDDLWLHAKDVSGSHVLIKYQAGKTFPGPVMEKAGQLAAYYSKNRNSNVCPVIYTEKKYVRKIKGAPPGTVRVDRENILFVNPSDHS
ncbi:MAG: DUF814 domain-containing protein [Cyclobacteriaceae bacterium]|nr:DUF814 domain-containing protein [Cyclobacteriaceae bacterium]